MGDSFTFHNKKLYKFDSLPPKTENVLVADEKIVGQDISISSKRALFTRVRFKNNRLNECVFKHTIFDDCYFRNCECDGSDFTGVFFRDCVFHKTSFKDCCFWYSRFLRCELEYSEFIKCLPEETNLAILLLQALRKNAIEMGDTKEADNLLKREVKVEQKELINRILCRNDYYKDHFNCFGRFKASLSLIGVGLNGLLLGHGLNIKNLLMSASAILILFAFLFWQYGKFFTELSASSSLNFGKSLYLSTITFTTLGYGDFVPASTLSYTLCAIESILGIVFLGFFAACAYRRFAK